LYIYVNNLRSDALSTSFHTTHLSQSLVEAPSVSSETRIPQIGKTVRASGGFHHIEYRACAKHTGVRAKVVEASNIR
jgi:hypothetical protein